MFDWLAANWGTLLFGILFAAYFALYVMAMRHQHRPGTNGKTRLPCDRC